MALKKHKTNNIHKVLFAKVLHARNEKKNKLFSHTNFPHATKESKLAITFYFFNVCEDLPLVFHKIDCPTTLKNDCCSSKVSFQGKKWAEPTMKDI